MKKLIFLFVALCVACGASAKVVLPKVLASNMVVQQNSEIEIWGKAEADKRVTVVVSWSKSKFKTQADDKGDWSVKVASITTSKPVVAAIKSKELGCSPLLSFSPR